MLTKRTEEYFEKLEKGVNEVYAVAEEARKKGLDPVSKVEVPLALTMAARAVGLISTIYSQLEGAGVAERILDLEKEYGKLDPTVVFTIAGEVANPANPPSGCYFNPRCKYAEEVCRTEAPEWREVAPEHFVSCHRAHELKLVGVG